MEMSRRTFFFRCGDEAAMEYYYYYYFYYHHLQLRDSAFGHILIINNSFIPSLACHRRTMSPDRRRLLILTKIRAPPSPRLSYCCIL